MSDKEDCFVCQKHNGLEFVPGGSIYEDELVFSGHSWSASDQSTPFLGGFIVEPKRHIPTWAELNDEEAESIGRVIRDVSKALKKTVNAEHIYVFVLGHYISHLHVWVLPRYPDTPVNSGVLRCLNGLIALLEGEKQLKRSALMFVH